LTLLLGAFSAGAWAGPARTVTGIVRDTTGAVLPGVTVHLARAESDADLQATTDRDGHYRFENVAAGAWALSFSNAKFETDKKTVQVGEQSAVFNSTLAMNAEEAAGQQGGQQQMPPMPNMPMPQAGAAPAPQPAQAAIDENSTDPRVLLERIRMLEERLANLESSAVLSEPETRVRRVEVYVDENSNEYDQPVPGARRVVTYQRERVYRRQTINEKIEEALSAEAERSVNVGVSAAIMPTGVVQTQGPAAPAGGRAYDLASADLYFTARVAQYTTFFADVVGLTGPTPDSEIQGLTLLNSYTARLVNQNVVNLREAWLRTELFRQSLAISAGRLDLTNFFDRNTVANDETGQFLSDALVNNPTLGLASNGAGVAVVYDPRRTYNFKFGFQQNDPASPNLSKSLVALAEVGYFVRPPFLQGGNYRVWVRTDNTLGGHKNAIGLSLDQKLTDNVTFFGRFGTGFVVNNVQDGTMHFYSGGFDFQKRFVLYPGDTWGIGYAQTSLTSGLGRERLGEIYYNFQLTERLRLSPRIQYLRETTSGVGTLGYFVPGVRLHAAF
jgi:hypothetical protein